MKTFRFKSGQPVLGTPGSQQRAGVTLMEVLMSVMIMSIGVVSLASLFPISILRGVQATQLTNATVLRYNAEALIDSLPTHFVFDPDGTLNANGHIAHQRANRKYVVDPLGAYYASLDGTGLEARFAVDFTAHRFVEPALDCKIILRESKQLVVGHALPKKIRKPIGQREIIQLAGLAREQQELW